METWRCAQAGADAPRDWGLVVQMGFGSTHTPDTSSSAPHPPPPLEGASAPHLVLLDDV